jgi:NAD(P)-dependent dehydrogenase (short-subunit alcohol dehydrogenase family)
VRLKGKVAVITGGNSGIGLATAHAFKANGAQLAIFGRDQETLGRAATDLGGDVLAIRGDVRNMSDLEQLFARTEERFGKIDVLMANAGIAKFAPVAAMSESLFDELNDILYKGVFFTVQKALPHMKDGSSIILVGAADSDKMGRSGTSIYSSAKAAVRSLARSLAVELLPRHIRVNTLSPGMTETPIISREGGMPGTTPEELAAIITAGIPMRRRGRPEELASAALFLASDESTYCLGSELLVDGGMTQLVNPPQ